MISKTNKFFFFININWKKIRFVEGKKDDKKFLISVKEMTSSKNDEMRTYTEIFILQRVKNMENVLKFIETEEDPTNSTIMVIFKN